MTTLSKQNENTWIVKHHTKDKFCFTYTYLESIVQIQVQSFQHVQDAFHDFMYLEEYFLKSLHPNKIMIDAPHSLYPTLKACGYYPKGKLYQKIVEPLRKKIDDSVFDSEGYIIDQGSLQSIPFGWFDTASKGCGWIATYNLLKMNGKYESMQTVISDLEKHGVLGKVFGQEIMWLIVYLKQKGLHVHLSLPGKKNCIKALEKVDNGILVYSHARGGHYATFDKVDATHVHLYNAIYKRKFHVVSLQQFLDTNVICNGCFIIGCKKG